MTLYRKPIDDDVVHLQAITSENERNERSVFACLGIFEMKAVAKHNGTDLDVYSSSLMPEVKAALLAHQITGMVHMLYKTSGSFPLSEEQKDRTDQQVADFITTLDCDSVALGGGLVEDTPGMGKTFTALTFFDWWCRNAEHLEDGLPCHRPTLLVVPDGVVVKQWAEAIDDFFPSIKLVIAKAGDPWVESNGKTRRWRYIGPGEVKNVTREVWPHRLRYVFDTKNPDASRTIILTSYATWRNRTVKIVEVSAEENPEKESGRLWDWIKGEGENQCKTVRHVSPSVMQMLK